LKKRTKKLLLAAGFGPADAGAEAPRTKNFFAFFFIPAIPPRGCLAASLSACRFRRCETRGVGKTMDEDLRKAALDYHRFPRPGKLAITATKRMETSRDLALAYSPGVAAACDAIKADPDSSFDYTSRANLVGVITNGTAVLGLGNIGALAGKPVMEGKAVLFKKFAGIDSFDIEVNEPDPDKFIEIVAALEPTFGGINLEDIKAPECFRIEQTLRARMQIPVFHDDQHGTAIIVGAAVLNAMKVQKKNISEVKIVTSGAGAAALSCVNILLRLGASPENVLMTDIEGVVYKGRPNLDPTLEHVARATDARTLADALVGADIFLGLSAPRQPRARNPAGTRHRRPPGRDHGDRPLGLPEPGQQRALFSLHLPGRARCPRDRDHREHETRRRRSHRRTRPGRSLGHRRRRLWRESADVRPGIHHPKTLRPALDHAHRPRRRPRRDGSRRRPPTNRRLGRL
jgi:hypothetical protein